MFDCIIVYVLEELTLSLHKGQREGQRDRYLDSMIIDGVHTENTEENGGPQADGGGERQLENNKYPQMSQMDTD